MLRSSATQAPQTLKKMRHAVVHSNVKYCIGNLFHIQIHIIQKNIFIKQQTPLMFAKIEQFRTKKIGQNKNMGKQKLKR